MSFYRPAWLAALAAALAVAVPSSAGAQIPLAAPTPDAQCQAMEPYVAAANQTMPQPAEAGAETTEIRLDCTAGTVIYVKRLLDAAATLAPGWQRLRQAVHSATYCGPEGATTRYGLVAIDEVHAPDGALAGTFITTPADCARFAGGEPLLTAPELDTYLEQQAATLRPTLPARVDDVTTLVSVFKGTGAMIYFYQLGFAVTEAQRPAIEASVGQLRAGLCADPAVRLVLGSGGTMTYRYSDSSGAPVFTVALAGTDCLAPG